ncbi:MAG TPA: alpha/beta hydrolase [Candidatus Dormibacteraeota bacterium]|nr:alpha/beta hydrolase [Candidatus Dormibacteraeota bacterium]
MLWVFQRQLIYFPGSARAGRASEVLPGGRDVILKTSDGLELGAWFFAAGTAARGVAVLVANGNAGNRSLRAPLAVALARAGLSALLFDYRGFGGNPGTPTEDGLTRDARAAQRFLVDEAGVRRSRLLYYGESLGAAVVTRLATEVAPGGLVLRSPFIDLASAGSVHYPFLPVRALLKDRYPVAELLAHVRVRTVVVYGTRDSIVPPEQSRAVAAAAAGPTRVVVIEGADHNDRALLDGPELIDSIVELADRVRQAS